MRSSLVGPAVAASLAMAVLTTAAPLEAQTTVGPTLAWEDDLNLGIGGTLRAPLASVNEQLGIMVEFLIFFPDAGDYFEINGHVTYDLPLEDSNALPFVLAGLTIGRTSGQVLGVDFSDTAARLNVGGGIEFDAGTLRPSAGLRVEFGDGDAFVLFASVPFALGG